MASDQAGFYCPSECLEFWLCVLPLFWLGASGTQDAGLASGRIGGFCRGYGLEYHDEEERGGCGYAR